MKITKIRFGDIPVPLRVPFKTTLRTVTSVEDITLEIHTDTGTVNYGETPPTGAMTEYTTGIMVGALKDHTVPNLLGKGIDTFEGSMQLVQSCVHKGSSAKTAADMTPWDLCGQLYKFPVYKLFDGARKQLVTDIIISVSEPEKMARDVGTAIARGYDCLKVKVGADPTLDVTRLRAVREVAGADIRLCTDASQAWEPKQAVRILNEIQEQGLRLEFIKQPVKAHDIEGLKYVTECSFVPVLADESVFSPRDTVRVSGQQAADLINIKLMKCGSIYNALRIVTTTEIYGVECVIGCILEAKISVNTAMEFACTEKVFTRIDSDGPVLCNEDPVLGDVHFEEKFITVSDETSMGIHGMEGLCYLD